MEGVGLSDSCLVVTSAGDLPNVDVGPTVTSGSCMRDEPDRALVRARTPSRQKVHEPTDGRRWPYGIQCNYR